MSRKDLFKWNLGAVVAAFAPLLVVELTHEVLSQTGPRLTMASSPQADAAASPETGPRPTRQQRAAATYAVGLQGRPIGISPFKPVAEAPRPTEPVQPAAPEPQPSPAPTLAPPDVSVKMIVRQRDGVARALISGKLRTVGDDMGDGWTIWAIDAAARTVTFAHDGAEPFTVTLKGPAQP